MTFKRKLAIGLGIGAGVAVVLFAATAGADEGDDQAPDDDGGGGDGGTGWDPSPTIPSAPTGPTIPGVSGDRLSKFIKPNLQSGTGGLYTIRQDDSEPNVARLALKHDPRTESSVGYGHPVLDDYTRAIAAVSYNRANYGTIWTPQQTHGRPQYSTADVDGTRYTTHWAYLPRHANNLMRMETGQTPERRIDAMGRGPVHRDLWDDLASRCVRRRRREACDRRARTARGDPRPHGDVMANGTTENYETATTYYWVAAGAVIAGTLLWAYRRDKRRGKLPWGRRR